MSDTPLIGWKNILLGSSYVVNKGAEIAGREFSNVWNVDLLTTAQIEADSSGDVKITVTIGAGDIPYGAGGYGEGSYGVLASDLFIIGAHRHDSAGFRTAGGRILATLDGTPVVDRLDIWPENASVAFPFDSAAGTTLVLDFTGFAAYQVVNIPELFFGPSIQMPGLHAGYDPYDEVSRGSDFNSESGRVYSTVRYKRLELSPRWRHIHSTLWNAVDEFREGALEEKNPFWYVWAPESLTHQTYLMRNGRNRAPFPYVTWQYRSFALKLEEAI